MDEPAQEPQQYCLRWNNHQSTIVSIFDTLYRTEALVDCQIAVEGGIVYKAHRVVLSACSPYFADLLKTYNEQMYPTIVVCGIGANEIEAIMSYMYRGEVNISQERLPSLLRIAEFLKIKGLSESNASRGTAHHQQQPQQLPGNPNKRQRISSVPGIESEAAGQDEAISPRRRRRGIRRRSHDNNDNSNSSAVQDSLVHHNAPGSAQLGTISLTGNASTASAYSAMPHYAAASLGLSASALSAQAPLASSPLSVSVTKKTESGKSGTGAASDTTNVQTAKLANAAIDEHNQDSAITKNTVDKSSSSAANHQKLSKSATLASGSNTTSSNNNREPSTSAAAAQLGTEMVIEPKAEYVEDANEENVEDLTLDDEDMATGMDDMDQAAGTSQAGEGSSQGYANWQHERSNQDDLVLATQEGQQRDPQDLSLTRIAGLRWNEWKSRMVNALPMVTTLHEGRPQTLLLPTDLTLERQQQIADRFGRKRRAAKLEALADNYDNDGDGDGELLDEGVDNGNGRAGCKTPTGGNNIKPKSERNSGHSCSTTLGLGGGARCNSENSTPRHGTSIASSQAMVDQKLNLNADILDAAAGVYSKYAKQLTEEEATALMLKAAAERSAAANNSGGNLSFASFGEDSMNLIASGGAAGIAASASDYQSPLASAVGSFTDVGSTAGLCNINVLSSLTAMMGGGSGAGSVAGNATATISLSGTSGFGGSANNNGNATNNSGAAGNNDGGGSGGHECPECKRKYKLKSSLRNHQKWECGKEPQFQCPFCSYRAKQKMHIGRHLERMHKEKFVKLELDMHAAAGDEIAVVAAAAAAAAAADPRQHF